MYALRRQISITQGHNMTVSLLVGSFLCKYVIAYVNLGARSRYLGQGYVIACNYLCMPQIPVSGNDIQQCYKYIIYLHIS